jgi:hypothetical protein
MQIKNVDVVDDMWLIMWDAVCRLDLSWRTWTIPSCVFRIIRNLREAVGKLGRLGFFVCLPLYCMRCMQPALIKIKHAFRRRILVRNFRSLIIDQFEIDDNHDTIQRIWSYYDARKSRNWLSCACKLMQVTKCNPSQTESITTKLARTFTCLAMSMYLRTARWQPQTVN